MSTNQRTTPVQVLDQSNAPLTRIVRVSTGADHTVALRADGTVWA